MKTWDAIVIGGGIIGLSVSVYLRRAGISVLLLERGQTGGEATHASAGMLAALDPETPAELAEFAQHSLHLYPGFVESMEAESGMRADLRREGTISLSSTQMVGGRRLSPAELQELEPELVTQDQNARYLEEGSVDPRALAAVALESAHKLGADIHTGSEVVAVEAGNGHVSGVRTDRTSYSAGVVVNCAGAWAASLGKMGFPTIPVKGQMLSLIMPRRDLVRHSIRGEHAYLVPRSDGRILVGATVERRGFDKTVDRETIQHLHHAASRLVPALGEARMHESWAGLRPGTPDGLPILGPTSVSGYFAATGHYRNGILLAPATAAAITELIQGGPVPAVLRPFAPSRFVT